MSYTSSPPLIRVYDSGSRQYGHRSSALPRHAAPSSPSLSSSSSHHSSSISSASGSTSAATAAAPMPIPHARGTSPPPPLPPPRYITGLDTGLHHHNHHGHMLSWQMVGSPRAEPPGHAAAFGPHHRSGLSLLGGGGGGGGGGGSSGGGRSRRPEGSHTQYTRRPSEETDAEVRGTGATGRRHSSSAATTTSSSTHTVDADLHTDADMSGDDENASTSRRPSAANRRLHSESHLGQRSLDRSSNAYDKQLLAKIGGPSTGSSARSSAPTAASSNNPPNSSYLSPTSTSSQEPSARNAHDRLGGKLKPLAVPERLSTSGESGRWAAATPISGVSPRGNSFRSPFDAKSVDLPSRRRSGPSHHAESYEEHAARGAIKREREDAGFAFMEHDFASMDSESGLMRDLNINSDPDQLLGSGAPLKRRAPSPPSESLREDRALSSGGGGGTDLYHRRSAQMLSSRHTSTTQPPHGSVSSATTSSSLGQKTGSLASNASWAHSVASSVTSYGDRPSPTSGLSPASIGDAMECYAPLSPYTAPTSAAGRGSREQYAQPTQQQLPLQHARTLSVSESEPSQSRKPSSSAGSSVAAAAVPAQQAQHSRQNSTSAAAAGSGGKMGGLHMCECCPKKPKKFESAAELRAHEQEKQYQCAFCPNRFKNKNEAERHQNSLHLRRHSWSCAALAGVHAAFYPSNSQPPSVTTSSPPSSHARPPSGAGAEAKEDICAYCGTAFANPPDWPARSHHLSEAHKWGECNLSKKFFRADHFRQHLKHSHAGASGKWTNVLEAACMKEEGAPSPYTPVVAGQGAYVGGGGGGRAGAPTSAPGSQARAGGVIDEVGDES